jgi:mannosyltransferase
MITASSLTRDNMTTATATDTDTHTALEQETSSFVREFTFPLPGWLKRQPNWVRLGGILLVLSLAALWVRTHYIGMQFWMDEGISVGIASHSLGSIPGILRMDGAPPLYYMLLHIWMQMFGNGEAATHWLSEIFAAITIPVGYWAGRTIATRRAGLMCATLFAFNAFLDYYSLETRMYTLMALLGLLATIGFINGFVYRRRRYVVLFSVSQALMFYTHAWAIYFSAGALISVLVLWRISGDEIRKNLLKDVLIAYAASVVVFLPWFPTFVFQAMHTAAPWDTRPRFGVAIQVAQGVFGGASLIVILLLAAGLGYAPLWNRRNRGTTESKVALMLLMLFVVTLFLAWCGSQVTPAWVVRYFAPVIAPMVILLSIGMSRAGVIGAIAIVFTVWFMMRPGAFEPQYKSDMQDIGAEMSPLLHKGDLVIVGQPESMPLAYYYLPGGLRWASTIGPVKDPTYMNWVDAMKRYRESNPYTHNTLTRELNDLKPGQQLLYIRPLTEGTINWSAPWTMMIRRRAAQYGAISADHQLKLETFAPHNYRGAPSIGDAAVLYKKVQ